MTKSLPNSRTAYTHLQQIVAGLTEGVVVVSPDGALSWADETALALHDVHNLKDLGGTADGYSRRFAVSDLSGDVLTSDEYPIQQLLAGEVIDKALFRVTRRADGKSWIHEIRTMILTNAGGEPDCLVVILNDETERFNAEQRFERAFGANPAPAIIVRLSDMRYVKVNRGFLELTEFTPAALIGHSIHEVDVLRGAEKLELARSRLHTGQTIPQMEGCLATRDGRDKTVLLAGQPIEIGDEACMLFTFADLHPRQQAQEALRQSEEKFAKAFHMAPCPIAIMALAGLRILDVNAAFSAATGWRREEILGRDEEDVRLWSQPDLRDDVVRQVGRTGHVASLDIQLRSKNGLLRDYLLSADHVDIHGERCVLSVMLDITERKQTESELLAAVQSVMQDTSWLGQKIVEKLSNLTRAKASTARQPELSTLSARAREVLELVAQGMADEEIASRLQIAQNTLRNHIAAIYAKLGLHKRSAVVVWARERGLGSVAQSNVKAAKSSRSKSRLVRKS